MDFTWDQKKALSNLKKHKVSFDEAVSVFYDACEVNLCAKNTI
jgi:uncharacterized DUF497 family protein